MLNDQISNYAKSNTDILDEYDPTYTNSDWLGIIENSEDPEFLGRCQVRVFGLFDSIDAKFLPWALPKQSNVFAGGKSKGGGSFSFPKKGSLVRVQFINGDIYHPEYTVLLEQNKMMTAEIMSSYENAQVLLYDEDEKVKIVYTKDRGLLIFKNNSIINIDKTDDIHIGHRDGGADIHITKDGNININGGNSVFIDTPHCQAGGDGAHPVVKADVLLQYLKALSAVIDTKIPCSPAATTLTMSFEPLLGSSQLYCGD